jgi:hypothetical protein
MNRLAKPADGSDGLVGSRNGALLRRFNLAVAPRPWECKKIYETESVGVPSILFLHQHLLHTVQPLPSSSSSVYPLSHVLQIAERLYQTPRLASLPEELRTSWVPSLPGSYPSSSLLQTLPPPSRLPCFSRFSRL